MRRRFVRGAGVVARYRGDRREADPPARDAYRTMRTTHSASRPPNRDIEGPQPARVVQDALGRRLKMPSPAPNAVRIVLPGPGVPAAHGGEEKKRCDLIGRRRYSTNRRT